MSHLNMPHTGEFSDEREASFTQRIALGIEYNGSMFCGYQRQSPTTRTIQDEMEKALSMVANEKVRLTCAGRTDTGVHATGQVLHFDTTARRELKAWTAGVNSNLPRDISVNWACHVGQDFSARFSALSRSYRYILFNGKVCTAIFRHHTAWSYEEMNAERMHRAAQYLLGENDFSAFRSSQCQSTHARRMLYNISVQRSGNYVILDIRGNAFLHHMVRNIMGTLMEVGRGERDEAWISEVLQGRDRNQAGKTAAAAGLYLVNVEYPEACGLPANSGWLPAIGQE